MLPLQEKITQQKVIIHFNKILNDLINDRQRTPEEQRERYNQSFPETAKNMKVTSPSKVQ